ncbi:MAG: hypothetical protein JSV21_07240 [Nitrospirota bacterium]|nr:MAG: hypothetical protein JSV21_07240 [Nitrospirota bacterium]
MDIAKEGVEGDSTLEKDGLNVYLDPQANAMLTNSKIDFNDRQGFAITGLEQSSSCGSCKC